MLEMVFKEGPEGNWEQTDEHWSISQPKYFSEPFLSVLFNFRNHKIQETKEPDVVLVSDDSVEEHKIADKEALAIEIRPVPD